MATDEHDKAQPANGKRSRENTSDPSPTQVLDGDDRAWILMLLFVDFASQKGIAHG
jgi:hypothetical protein